MDGKSARNLWSRSSWSSRGKQIYNRITLSKLTTSYFGLAFIICLVLFVLQSVTLADNSKAVTMLSKLLSVGNITEGLAVAWPNGIAFCDDLPGQATTNCVPLGDAPMETRPRRSILNADAIDISVYTSSFQRRDMDVTANRSPSGLIVGVLVDDSIVLDRTCLQSLLWLEDTIRDARREDIVTLAFQIWLFSLAFVTILSESLPHLGAGFLGHVLGTAWAGFRVSSSSNFEEHYQRFIVNGTCGMDLMGDWWAIRTSHAIPIVAMNAFALVTTFYLSFKLFRVYAHQSFSRVEASPAIRKVYKLVLLLSVCLQLAGFFLLASTGIWIDKISSGTLRHVAHHLSIYLATFIVNACLLVPWLVLGWLSVRRERRIQFVIFIIISVLLLVISTVAFASPLYQFIFMMWPFFATMTLTSYILLVVTCGMGIVCRLHFGRGLAHFLQVSSTLEGMGFTPSIYFHYDSKTSSTKDLILVSEKEKELESSANLPYVQIPKSAYHGITGKRERGQIPSVYSDPTRETVKLSSTPSVARGVLSRPTSRSTRASVSTVATASTGSTTTARTSPLVASSFRGKPKPVAGMTPEKRRYLRSISPVPSFHAPKQQEKGTQSKMPKPPKMTAGLPSNPRAETSPRLPKPEGNYF